MASITPAKKEIIDFLWEWANAHDNWGKLLVEMVVKTEQSLSKADRQNVFDFFIDSLRAQKKLVPPAFVKPLYAPANKIVKLKSLKEVDGVNKLAKDQIINFSKNITVIYGENGSGKTGYGRILKSLGFSYDTKNIIHHNVFEAPKPKSAVIEFITNEIPTSFKWTGENNHADLKSVSIFNSNCVNLSLVDRQLIVSPMGFHLFNILTAELSELSNLLEQKIASHPIAIAWIDTLNEGSPQKQFLSTLNVKSTEDRLIELSTFLEFDEKKLQESEKQLSNLNPDLIRTQIATLKSQSNELTELKERVFAAQIVLNQKRFDLLLDLNRKNDNLEKTVHRGLKEVAESNGIAFYETKEFKEFIKSADTYLKLLDKENYPDSSDMCLYCNQPLDKSAQELLANYKRILNDTTQEQLDALRKQREGLISSVNKIETNLKVVHGTFGNGENGVSIQPSQIINYNKRLSELKSDFEQNSISEEWKFDLEYDTFILFLENEKERVVKELNTKIETLQSLNNKGAELRNIINELKDRKFISTRQTEVKTVIQNVKIVDTLRRKSSEFNSNSISRKTTEAREALIRQDFDSIFRKELKSLRKSDIPVELNFGTERGNSKVIQRIKSYNLSEILSEGEQKAIALAEFLTELQMDNIKAPVIFDDPVNSLDHKIIDEVAKRLIELSKDRQVIIFTHSVLLLNCILQQRDLEPNKKNGMDFTFHLVKRSLDRTGILDKVDGINTITHYRDKVVAVINGAKGDVDEAKLAAEGYGHLRSAIEVSVEEDVLQKIIKRYRKGVAFPSLLRIDGKKIDIHKQQLNDIYEKCCVSIDGHSSPSEIGTTPTIEELKIDLESFDKIRSSFKK